VVRKRILWIDVAKAIAIICMIIGHIVPLGELRNLIYSFHMPLFFVLTGFTMKKVSTRKEFFCQIKKDFFRILIPYLTIYLADNLMSIVVFKEEVRVDIIMDKLMWASAVEVKGHLAIGAIWFLFILFCTKVIFSLVRLLFPTVYNGIIFMFAALVGQIIAINQEWMIFSIDIVFVAVFYMYIGSIMKDNWEFIESRQMPITIIAWFVWMFYWNEGLWVEMATRYYPKFPMSIFMSLCGCICVFILSKAIENLPRLAKILGIIGKHTLAILGVHYLSFRFMYLWENGNIVRDSFFDIAVAFGGAFILVFLKKGIILLKKEKAF